MTPANLADFAYFRLIHAWMCNQIDALSHQMVQNTVQWISHVALILVTLWVLLQGYRLATGQLREPAMTMVAHMVRIALVVTAATSVSLINDDLRAFVTQDMSNTINLMVNSSSSSMAATIDENLAYTQLAMAAIDSVQVPYGDKATAKAKSQAMLFATLGTTGPAMSAGGMLLMYQVGMALILGLAPLFILCLVFDQTKELFRRWAMFAVSTLFSMAILDAVVAIALKATINTAAALWTSEAILHITGTSAEGFNSQALQQGGVGLLMTVLIISVPPMAAALFRGALGTFMPYSAFGSGGGATSGRRQPIATPLPYGNGLAVADAPPHQGPISHQLGGRHTAQRDLIKRLSMPDDQAMAAAAYGDPRYWTAQVGPPAQGTQVAITTEESNGAILSNASWVKQFPGSDSTETLVEPFRSNVNRFIAALESSGGNVKIAATQRPPERAYLMHYAALIASGTDPETVPSMPGVDIQWVHHDSSGSIDLAASRTAAQAMARSYGIVYPPALSSRHTEGRAIDMAIDNVFGKTFIDGSGQSRTVSNQKELESLGASYGVVKLPPDEPHWSDDGH